jgi:hypothetical protein
MIRAILSLAITAMFFGCADSSTASTESIPSGLEAPRLTVTVLKGTKAAPVDTPVVKIEWVHRDSTTIISIGLFKSGDSVKTFWLADDGAGSGEPFFNRVGNGVFSSKISRCTDSVFVFTQASAIRGYSKTDSTWVYCK